MLKASSRCEVWQQQGSRLSAVAQNSALLPGLEQTECQAGPRTTACPAKLPGVKASRGHSAKLPGRSQRTYQRGKQPTTRFVSESPRLRGARRQGQKGGKCERVHLSDTQTTLSNWQACLQPLNARDVRVGNMA